MLTTDTVIVSGRSAPVAGAGRGRSWPKGATMCRPRNDERHPMPEKHGGVR